MIGALVDRSRPGTEPHPLCRARVAVWYHGSLDYNPGGRAGTVRHACPLVTFRALLAFVSFSSGLPLTLLRTIITN